MGWLASPSGFTQLGRLSSGASSYSPSATRLLGHVECGPTGYRELKVFELVDIKGLVVAVEKLGMVVLRGIAITVLVVVGFLYGFILG